MKKTLRDYLPILMMLLCAAGFGALLLTGVIDLNTVPQLVEHRPVLAVLVILALTPAPERLPAPWRLAGVRSYVAAGSGRWFWALSPSSGTDVAAGKSALDGPAGEDGPCPG